MTYLELLEYSFKYNYEKIDTHVNLEHRDRYVYLSDFIFDFTVYDDALSKLLARKAIEVCAAISNRTTFDYIENKENYEWFIIMCNMDFFKDKISWGTSIRGAWWDISGDETFELSSCGLFNNEEQILEPLMFDKKQWEDFIKDIQKFVEKS